MILSSSSPNLDTVNAFESDIHFLQNIIGQLSEVEQKKLTTHADHLMTEEITQIQHMGERIQRKMVKILEEQEQIADHKEELDILRSL